MKFKQKKKSERTFETPCRFHWIPHALSGNLESRFQSLARFRFSLELYLGFQFPRFRIRFRTALNGATFPSGNYQDLSKCIPSFSVLPLGGIYNSLLHCAKSSQAKGPCESRKLYLKRVLKASHIRQTANARFKVRIGHLHDDVILILRAESFRTLLSCANYN